MYLGPRHGVHPGRAGPPNGESSQRDDESRMSTVRYQAFTVAELEKQQGTDGYREFLRRSGMSLWLYTLSVGGTDAQHPHAADEVYVVLSGRGVLQVEGRSVEVGPGSVLSVDRGADHRFTDISEDLTDARVPIDRPAHG